MTISVTITAQVRSWVSLFRLAGFKRAPAKMNCFTIMVTSNVKLRIWHYFTKIGPRAAIDDLSISVLETFNMSESDDFQIRVMRREEVALAIDLAAAEGWNPSRGGCTMRLRRTLPLATRFSWMCRRIILPLSR